ncbi:MAG: tetratricopeptide repeat protein [Nitrospiraceae bacterium]|nr:MAG: tetratricopeptide repeat protein [Nitrospiraceae bacterium]
MGKDKILDAVNKKKVKSLAAPGGSLRRELRVKSFKIIFYLIAFSLLTFNFSLLTSCAFPKIIILDDPLSPEEHINLGVAYEKKGEVDNALKEYRLASKKLPLAYLYIGNIYFQKKDYDEAESAYKKAIDKDSQNADAHNNLAWLYYTKKENLNEAESLALKAIELNPSKKELYQDTLDKIRGAKSKL